MSCCIVLYCVMLFYVLLCRVVLCCVVLCNESCRRVSYCDMSGRVVSGVRNRVLSCRVMLCFIVLYCALLWYYNNLFVYCSNIIFCCVAFFFNKIPTIFCVAPRFRKRMCVRLCRSVWWPPSWCPVPRTVLWSYHAPNDHLFRLPDDCQVCFWPVCQPSGLQC